MIEQAQPRTDAGKYSFKQQSESGQTLGPAAIGERLAEVDAALAADSARWNAKKGVLRKEDLERQQRRGRIAGVRAASRIMNVLPTAATMSYTRNPVSGVTTFDEIRDVDNATICSVEDLTGSAFRGRHTEEGERREAVRDAVRLLAGTSLPPEHEAQGITVHSNHERLDLATALDDGLKVLDADELTPEQASIERTDAAMSHWVESEDHLQEAVRDMFTDMRHYAERHGIDIDEAFEKSLHTFIDESHDPVFKEGL